MENNRQDRYGAGDEAREGAMPADAFGHAGPANTPTFQGEGAADATPAHARGAEATAGEERGAGAGAAREMLAEGREAVAGRMEGMRNRVESQLDDGMRTTADRMEGIAQRLDEVADSRMSGGGVRGRAGEVAHTVADRMESTAGYLREQDAHTLISRVEDQVRERPIETLLAAVAAGWLVGKLLR